MPRTRAANSHKSPAAAPAASPAPRASHPATSAPAASLALAAPPSVQRLADPGATARADLTNAPFGAVVDDGTAVAPGQITRTELIDRIAEAVGEMANDELAKVDRGADDCPYLTYWLSFYRDKPAARLERAIQRYANPDATDPDGLVAAVLTRATGAMQLWIASGKVAAPPNVSWMGASDGLDGPGDAPPPVQAFGGGMVGRADPAAVGARLGAGAPLDMATRTRMERGFGRSFGGVRVHHGSGAAGLSRSLSARAFTVGDHIAFGAGQYRPGTLAGDAMLAHELAHTVQQSGVRTALTSSNEAALESNADHVAARALAPPRATARHAEAHEADAAPAASAIHKWRATGEIDAPAGTDSLLGGDAALVAMTSSLRGGEPAAVPEAVASTLGAPAPEVRVHTDATANRLAERAGALAYTVGNHIVYSASAPRPGSLAGDALLAHELAHTHQQRGTAGRAASVADAETNADRGVAHAAASKLGLRGILGRTWSAVPAPLGLQRCKSKSNDAEIAQHRQELADVKRTIDAARPEFSGLAAAITKREALEHWISTLSGGRGTRTGTNAAETGVEGCNCTTYVVLVLREAFKKSGREADWKKVLARTYKIKGKREVDGVEIQSALRSELGWKAIFWAPDPLYPSYQRRPRPYDHAPAGTQFVHDTENKERYDLAARADKPVYRINPGTKSEDDLRISHTVINYAPETAGRSITIAGGDSTTPKDTTGLDKLGRILFGVLTARGGTHMALIVSGVVYEVHWDQHSDSPRLYARTPLETWGWGSGIIVAPGDEVDKAFK